MNKFLIPQLPYALDSLAPVISLETMNYHYGKHLQAYIDNTNMLKDSTPFADKDLETIIKTAEGALFNNAAQTYNHIFYFFNLSPIGGGTPSGELLEAIEHKWKTFDGFKKEFSDKAISLFGSGWVWLQCNSLGELSVEAYSNAGNPLTKELFPLMTVDVWEHSYYLDHQNRRTEYVSSIWDIIDWKRIGEHYNF